MSMDSLAANRLGVAGRSQEYGESLLNALKSKLEDRAGEHANILEPLTPKVRKRVEALRQLQSRRDELEAKFLQERAVLEAKYQKLYEPLDTERYYIVNGVKEVEGVTNEVAADEQEKGVPRFWVNAMKTLEVLGEEISERDEAALQYLKDIKWHRIENSKGFKLEFFFDTNPFFKNEVLTKTYHMIDEDGLLMEKATGTEIKWYPGKCLTQVLKKMPDEGLKDAKPITETETCESFFNFFSPPQVPKDDDDMDEDTAEKELKNRMEQDYEVGSNIRDKIIPHAVCWFTGEAAQDEFEAMDDDEEDDEDEDDEDEDEGEDEDDDEDDDDDDEEAVRECRKKKGGRAPVGDECEFPPECKLQ